ncbi:hypothetical protein D5S17_35870 [Pseudonocardiaceae bacterium YIM PH 21723]|nr:hypothetical protein D5S17_35870 [Pseudonocardiaceae bacterium YIM PH 21723]
MPDDPVDGWELVFQSEDIDAIHTYLREQAPLARPLTALGRLLDEEVDQAWFDATTGLVWLAHRDLPARWIRADPDAGDNAHAVTIGGNGDAEIAVLPVYADGEGPGWKLTREPARTVRWPQDQVYGNGLIDALLVDPVGHYAELSDPDVAGDLEILDEMLDIQVTGLIQETTHGLAQVERGVPRPGLVAASVDQILRARMDAAVAEVTLLSMLRVRHLRHRLQGTARGAQSNLATQLRIDRSTLTNLLTQDTARRRKIVEAVERERAELREIEQDLQSPDYC